MTDKHIAIIQTGQAIPSALVKYGDFDQWFINAMQTKTNQTKTYRVFENLIFPNTRNLAGIIITGSGSMVTEEFEWSEATINWLKPLVDKGIPILGVCYGHQLLAKLFGGNVDWNPNGREIWNVSMRLSSKTLQDNLFKNLVEPPLSHIDFFATHQQSIIQLPSNVTLLGSTSLDPYHCFRYNNHIWGTQFHPEFTSNIISDYIHARSKDIIYDGLNPIELLANIKNNKNGNVLLQRFKDICFSN